MLTHHQGLRLSPAPDRTPAIADALQTALGDVARRLRRSVPDLTERDRQLLHDLDRGRMPMRTLVRLLAIAVRSPLAHHREAPAEMVRAIVLRHAAPESQGLADVLDAEDDANASFDKAVRRYFARPSGANRVAAIEAGQRQLAETRAVLDLIYAAGGDPAPTNGQRDGRVLSDAAVPLGSFVATAIYSPKRGPTSPADPRAIARERLGLDGAA